MTSTAASSPNVPDAGHRIGRSGVIRQVLILIGIALLLSVAANALSPRGIPWRADWSGSMAVRAARAGLVPVDAKRLKAIVHDRSAVLLDARSSENYLLGRIPGARSLPLRAAENTAERPLGLSPDQPLVVYCGSAFCDAALEVGQSLRRRGYRSVSLFVEGYDAWVIGGGEVEQDSIPRAPGE